MGAFAEGALINQLTSTVTSGGTTTLTVASTTWQRFTGNSAETVVLPDATTMRTGREFIIANTANGDLTVQFNGGATAAIISPRNQRTLRLYGNGTAAGDWHVGQQTDLIGPLDLTASYPNPDGRLNIGSSTVVLSNGITQTTFPSGSLLSSTLGSSIDFQSGAATGGVTGGAVTTDGGTFTRPTVTSGQFTRMAVVFLNSGGTIDTTFSTAAATQGALTDVGELFADLNGMPLGYIDLESEGSFNFKTPGAAAGLVEDAGIVRTERRPEFQTIPLKMATGPTADRVLDIGPILVTDLKKGIFSTIPPINDTVLPTFTGGTVTLPAASGGNAVPSVGSNLVITISPNNFLKMRIAIDVNGDLVLSTGVEGATEAAATLPLPVSDAFDIGYVSIRDVGGVIQNIAKNNIYQFGGGGGGGGGALDDFKIKSITGDDAVIGKGTQKLMGGQILITGSGTTQATMPVEVTINLDTVLGTAPAASTSYWLYVDKYALETPITFSDTGREVIRVEDEADFAILTTSPENTDPFRYLPVGHLFSASDNTWDGSGANFETTAVVRESFGTQVYSPLSKASSTVSTAAASNTFAHGLGVVPDVVEFTYYDGTDTKEVDGSNHSLNLTATNADFSSLGLTFGSGETLTCTVLAVSSQNLVATSSITEKSFGPYTGTGTTQVAHGYDNAEDIRGMFLIEHDVSAGEYLVRDATELVTDYDGTNINFDWSGLSPSATLTYKLVSSGAPLPSALPVYLGGYTKFVGFGPGTFTTLTAALSGAAAGDSILIGASYTISAQEDITVDDIRITFMPGVVVDTTSAIAESMWKISSDRVDIKGMNLKADFSGAQTAGLRVEGDDCNITESRIEIDDAGLTLTDAYLIHSTSNRSYVNGSARATTGTITNTVTDNGTDTGIDIRG